MTEESKDSIRGLLGLIKEWIIVGGSLVAILAGMWWTTLWFTGGLKPQTQVDQDAFRAQLNLIQTAQEKNATANTAANDRIMARLDALPRPSDYTNQESHLSRIDQALLTAYDRVTQVEVAASKLAGRFESLLSDTTDRANKPKLGRSN